MDCVEVVDRRQPGLFDQPPEEWRPVVGWDGFYEVSSLGRVRRLDTVIRHSVPGYLAHHPGRILRHGKNHAGYHRVTFSKNNMPSSHAVATLVCVAFHGPNPGGMEVAHNNGCKDDNSAANLAWKTHVENEADKRWHGTLAIGLRNGKYTKPEKTPRGELHGCAKCTTLEVVLMRYLYRTGMFPSRRLATMFSLSKTNVLSQRRPRKTLTFLFDLRAKRTP
jgi:hypothetical protein